MQFVVANPKGVSSVRKRARRVAGRARHGFGVACAHEAAAVRALVARSVFERPREPRRPEAPAAGSRPAAVAQGICSLDSGVDG